MSGNTFGKAFRVTTWGESHGPAIGAVVDGCPPGIPLTEEAVQVMMDRRKPGASAASTTRKEEDLVHILSGVFEGLTTGTPISLMIKNKDAKSSSYDRFKNLFRPGHGDLSYQKKYGIRDYKGGGRASARETAGRVAAGAVAGLLLEQVGIKTFAYTLELGSVKAKTIDPEAVAKNPFACPDMEAAEKMEARVNDVRKDGDSLGGVVQVQAAGVPAGLGEPVFDKIDAQIAKAMMSIGAVKGVEIGAGFEAARLTGSVNNDPIWEDGFETNNAGGTLAGVSSGQDIVVRVAVKPIPSISVPQQTIDVDGKEDTIQVGGRHDISAIPRVNVVCEAMLNLVLADFVLRQAQVRALELFAKKAD
ncbi:chorismate synthase [Desulfatibacillum alkenivorans DSM 16219]|jgi:chorismate synthase|uniref:Chorismate synthase n=1 Tax=Desulfatibacillum alkenivorans DSM 16219 TaxID=1121393 RepID=A0A1M6CQV2_9BACT|nr:chorismate synthase [Desulfatibacillum alkenivorans]SHI63397.1 chorismate synthase [Desulfatibacillum alkenivorans DSM 16219]